MLVREAAQNSWDARSRDDDVPLQFQVSIRRIGEDLHAWRRLLLPPPHPNSAIDLSPSLNPDTTLLVVSDRGTVGLGGPLRAGQRPSDSERPDFVQFIRNVGEPSDHEFGGGTYGFGKGIFFRLSRVTTILMDTQTVGDGPTSRRLMGAALGQSWYDESDRRYTGRHWWGTVADDDIPDPLTGAAAAQMSAELGLPGFDDGRKGTDIVVVAADLGTTWADEAGDERTREAAGEFVASSMLWHLWPKMLMHEGRRPMTLTVTVDGVHIPVPAPESTRDLRPFADALNRLRSGCGNQFTRATRPRTVGSFAYELVPARDVQQPDPLVAAAKPFAQPMRHVARMRMAELVADYLECTPHPDPLFGYAGVFKASREADHYFAGAEPPTHDDWVEKGLTGTARGVVWGARRSITKQIQEIVTPRPIAGGAGTAGLGEIARRLSGLIPGGVLAQPTAGQGNGSEAAPDQQRSSPGSTSHGSTDESAGGAALVAVPGRRRESSAPLSWKCTKNGHTWSHAWRFPRHHTCERSRCGHTSSWTAEGWRPRRRPAAERPQCCDGATSQTVPSCRVEPWWCRQAPTASGGSTPRRCPTPSSAWA
ncbi:hypothetical protein ACFQ1L_01510 [Phytohabitans flavus]|uniref:hypothetical protein n=1 Tax=Phytohabitans flavus TaxID=1076124 RepID=UPI003634D408